MSFTVSVSLYQKETWMGRIAWPAFAWLGLDLLAHSHFANHGCPILWRRKLPTALLDLDSYLDLDPFLSL